MEKSMLIQPDQLSLEKLRAINQQQVSIELAASARTSIATESLNKLQCNLILPHCTGTGPLLDDATVGLTLALKVDIAAARAWVEGGGFARCLPCVHQYA
jgi:histidine ammonia-lyase